MTQAAAPAGAATVLVVEDEPSLVATLSWNLRKDGFRVITATDGVAGLQAARAERPDVVVLDLMLPKMDGLEVCRRLRAESDVPVLILTAKGEEVDRVVGLEMGADDYLAKPFGMRELMARIRALLRRSAARVPEAADAPITAGAIVLDPRGRTVRRDGAEVALKPREFDLLLFLARNAGQVFTREQILERVWGYEFFGGSRTVDVHVRWLREKLEADPAHPAHLLTVRGVGYKFVR
ncbi:MAG TPA: response regulator transcription factor [Dehalococcoidia bacterium]|jgi:DNA-binding response OmpR family regulator|nr:response regulator transcription factor [Dehalococcoidia bacterium]